MTEQDYKELWKKALHVAETFVKVLSWRYNKQFSLNSEEMIHLKEDCFEFWVYPDDKVGHRVHLPLKQVFEWISWGDERVELQKNFRVVELWTIKIQLKEKQKAESVAKQNELKQLPVVQEYLKLEKTNRRFGEVDEVFHLA